MKWPSLSLTCDQSKEKERKPRSRREDRPLVSLFLLTIDRKRQLIFPSNLLSFSLDRSLGPQARTINPKKNERKDLGK